MIELGYYNLDCMEGMKEYPDKYFELAIVDPPYGIGETGQRNNADRPTKKWKNPNSQTYKPFDDSKIPNTEYFAELFRVSKNQIIWGANYFTQYLPSSSGWIVWDKVVNEKEHLAMCELAYSSFDRRLLKFEYLWAGFKKAEQVVRIHPTQKPIKLYEWILTNYAKPGDKIIDTHVGSGSSIIAFEKHGFEYCGFEIDSDYYEASMKRILKHRELLKQVALEYN